MRSTKDIAIKTCHILVLLDYFRDILCFIPNVGTFYSQRGNNYFYGKHNNPQPLHKEGRKIEFCVFAQDLTVSRKEVPVYRCFTRF